MGKEGRSPWDSGHRDCHSAAVCLLPPHPLSLKRTRAGAQEEALGKPRGPCPVPAALHINLGAYATIVSPSLVPEERGAWSRDRLGRAWPAVRSTRFQGPIQLSWP